MPIFAFLRTLFSLIVAGAVGLFAAGTIAPPPELTTAPTEQALPSLPLVHNEPSGGGSGGGGREIGDAEPSPPPQEPIEIPQLSSSIIDTQTRGAVVHLLCTTKNSRSIRTTTGSGVIIDPRGIVLTNAHVAQFWLLPQESVLGTTECRVRAAIPIDREYRAELLYFPKAWAEEHVVDINSMDPKGTGEHDYALLRITEPISSKIIFPAVFPFVTYSADDQGIETGDGILIAAYPAMSSAESVKDLRSLEIVSTITTIHSVFTFKQTTLDLISLGSSALSFKGSSGGAVIDENNQLIALITTSTDGETAADRELRAITLAHIDRSLVSHIGLGLAGVLSGNLETKADEFNTNIVPSLTDALLSEL